MKIENTESNKKQVGGLEIFVGKDEYGKDLIINLATLKHLLIAGCTGSGKSVLLHKIICTLLSRFSPKDIRFIMIDPKRVELTLYNNVPHLLTPVIMESKKTVLALKWIVKEMERRYDILKESDCRDIYSYQGAEHMPYIVIVIDEFSDLMQAHPKEMEESTIKIARMGHVVGIHIILSTSRPSTKVVTNSIRDAINAHIAFQVSSIQDSKIIIGNNDAQKLRGAGDMLFRDGLKYPIRAQVDMISEEEVKSLTNDLQKTYKDFGFDDVAVEEPSDETEDDLYDEARAIVLAAGKASTSYIQRKLRIGYARSARLIDLLEERGVIEAGSGAAPRKVLNQIKKEKELSQDEPSEQIKGNDDPWSIPVLINKDGKKDTRKTILMIDDDTFLLNMYGSKFSKAGFNMYIVASATGNFIQNVLKVKPDLISLDIIMPGRDGFEAMKILKSDKRTKDIPVIFLSNQSNKTDISEAENLGAADYIVCAYITPSELVDKYSSYLEDSKSYIRWMDNPPKELSIE